MFPHSINWKLWVGHQTQSFQSKIPGKNYYNLQVKKESHLHWEEVWNKNIPQISFPVCQKLTQLVTSSNQQTLLTVHVNDLIYGFKQDSIPGIWMLNFLWLGWFLEENNKEGTLFIAALSAKINSHTCIVKDTCALFRMVSRHSFNLPWMAGSSEVMKNIGCLWNSFDNKLNILPILKNVLYIKMRT